MLNIPVEESEYCLCAHQVPENPKHLFVECNWINSVRTGMVQWTRVTLYDSNGSSSKRRYLQQ